MPISFIVNKVIFEFSFRVAGSRQMWKRVARHFGFFFFLGFWAARTFFVSFSGSGTT